MNGGRMNDEEPRGVVGRIILSLLLCFGQTAAAMVWLKASGPIGWIFAFCCAIELLFFVRLRLARSGANRRSVARTLIDRLTKVGLWAVFLFGAGAIIIGLDITPASAYLAWFQLVQEGAGGGTLAYMFAVKFAYFAALFGGFFMIGSRFSALLNLAAVDLLIAAILLGRPGLAAIGLLLFLTAVGRRAAVRNPGLKPRAVLAAVQISVVALVVALPLSIFQFRNRLIDDLFNVRMEGFVASIFPNFPFLYNVPGYGYTLGSSKIGDRPALTSRPVFEVTAPAGSTIYIRTGVYDTYTGEGWDLGRFARRRAEREVLRYESAASDPSLVPTERISFKILIDFYSSLPHTLGTVAFQFPDHRVPPTSLAGLGAGFVLDTPLQRGSEITDLVTRPSDSTPRPVVVGFGGEVFPGDTAFPQWGGGYLADRSGEPALVGSSGWSEFDPGRSGPAPADGKKVVLPQLLSTISDNGEYRASHAKAAAEVQIPVAPRSAGRGENAAPPAAPVGTPSAQYWADAGTRFGAATRFGANDGDADDAVRNHRGFGTSTTPFVGSNGRLLYRGSSHRTVGSARGLRVPPPKYGLQYERYVLTPRERIEDLQTGDVPERLRVLAARLGAGKSQPATIRAIRSYLVDNYKYSLTTTTSGPYDDAVSNFLFSSKMGFCVQFASAFVILARLNGIPARYVTGFLANLPNGSDRMTVTGLSAHSWAETWNSRLGWVTQEATPPMLAAESGDPNVLQQFNPGDSSFTQRQLVALLGGRLIQDATTPVAVTTTLSENLAKMSSPLLGLPSRIAGGVVLLALLLLLLRYSYFRIAPVEIRFRRVVRLIAKRSKARGLPDPALQGWREWSRGVGERNPARSPAAYRAAVIIHRSFFAGRTNGYGPISRDVAFLRRLYRGALGRTRASAAAPRREAPVP